MTSVNGSTEYASANAFRRALEDRLKREAKLRGQSLEDMRRQFLFQRFLALLFSGSQTDWVLKGGASLLMRLARARSSKDLDLVRLGELDAQEAIDELRALTRAHDEDHLRFVVEEGVTYSQLNPVIEISVTVYCGARYGAFSIDLARDLHLLAKPERIRPEPVVTVPGLAGVPEIVVYSLTDQVADKVCAMYQRYGAQQMPSSRYRDLVDLALIVSNCTLDAESLCAALASESARRQLRLPTQMVSPSEGWASGYGAYAPRTPVDRDIRQLDAALTHVGSCLNPLLAGSRRRGTWSPEQGWVD